MCLLGQSCAKNFTPHLGSYSLRLDICLGILEPGRIKKKIVLYLRY